MHAASMSHWHDAVRTEQPFQLHDIIPLLQCNYSSNAEDTLRELCAHVGSCNP